MGHVGRCLGINNRKGAETIVTGHMYRGRAEPVGRAVGPEGRPARVWWGSQQSKKT